MTRKRFIKLMMSRGIHKNQAMRIADGVKQYGSYHEMFESYRLILAINNANKIFEKIAEVFADVVSIIAEVFAKFNFFNAEEENNNDVD